jgi:hypothetical protein
VSRTAIARLSRALAELKAKRAAKDAPRIVAEELRAIGCHAVAWANGDQQGVTVDSWDSEPELDEARERKLSELEARGIGAFVVVIDRIEERATAPIERLAEHASGTAETAKASEGVRGGGAAPGAQPPTTPATPGARVTDPPTKKGRKHV